MRSIRPPVDVVKRNANVNTYVHELITHSYPLIFRSVGCTSVIHSFVRSSQSAPRGNLVIKAKE